MLENENLAEISSPSQLIFIIPIRIDGRTLLLHRFLVVWPASLFLSKINT